MFPAAVSHGNSADSWNISAARPPVTSIEPALTGSSPATRFSSVDLPQPDAPSRQTNSPGATVRSMPSSTGMPASLPNHLDTPFSRTAASVSVRAPGASSIVTVISLSSLVRRPADSRRVARYGVRRAAVWDGKAVQRSVCVTGCRYWLPRY